MYGVAADGKMGETDGPKGGIIFWEAIKITMVHGLVNYKPTKTKANHNFFCGLSMLLREVVFSHTTRMAYNTMMKDVTCPRAGHRS